MATKTNMNGISKSKKCESDGVANTNGIASLIYPKKQSRGPNNIQFQGTYGTKRIDISKWNGWGYRDSYFYIKDDILRFNGDRYSLSGTEMIHFKEYLKANFDLVLDANVKVTDEDISKDYKYQKSKLTNEQLRTLQKLSLKISQEGCDRLHRSHGQTNEEMYNVQKNTLERIVDVVMWPECHEDVVEIVRICNEENIVIIPYGGGSCVNEGLLCPENEERPILSLDTSLMNEILSVDKESLVACCESGILGQDLERELQKIGYTVGHEPDSIEFSSLGGWVSTRASGMKKNTYGNIEDLVINVRMVTPSGVLEKNNRVPRLSCGPDFNHLIIGSEGNYGVVTEVTLKIRPLPECSRYGSYIFPDFKSGAACLREVARLRCQPASLRLMDNGQFQLGRCFREKSSYFQQVTDVFSKFYLTKVRGYDLSKMSVATIKYEDTMEVVNIQENKLHEIAVRHGGISTGSINGERGYNMTFAIAYIRDFTILFDIESYSFETSVPWNKLMSMIKSTEDSFAVSCHDYGIVNYILIYRLAQVYDAGACVYFYFVFHKKGMENHSEVCNKIVKTARDVIIKSGGSISHHHGVGKSRSKWYKDTVSPMGLEIFKACKTKFDPKNIFAVNNIVTDTK